MKRFILLSGAVVACLAAAIAAATPTTARHQAPQTKPVKEIPFHIDGTPPPPVSIDELWQHADIVFEGVVEAMHPVDMPVPGRTPAVEIVYTAYEFRVTEVFKRNAAISENAKVVRVQRKGGIRDRGAFVERHIETGFPLFEKGQRYVIFAHALSGGRFSVDADAAFLVEADQLVPRGKGEIGRSVGHEPSLLRELLRQRRGVR